MKFEFISEKLEWDREETHMNLICALTGEALAFAHDLPVYIRYDLPSLVRSLENRFGDHVLAETHRAALWNLRRGSEESLQEYAARTRSAVSKAYPGMQGTPLLEKLTVEHLVQGLGDSDMAYNVLAQRPETVIKTLDLIQWYECCKSNLGKKPGTIRQVFGENPTEVDDEVNVRQISQERKFVTEKRLGEALSKFREGMLGEISKLLDEKLMLRKEYVGIECYRCREMGHYARDCLNREADAARARSRQEN